MQINRHLKKNLGKNKLYMDLSYQVSKLKDLHEKICPFGQNIQIY